MDRHPCHLSPASRGCKCKLYLHLPNQCRQQAGGFALRPRVRATLVGPCAVSICLCHFPERAQSESHRAVQSSPLPALPSARALARLASPISALHSFAFAAFLAQPYWPPQARQVSPCCSLFLLLLHNPGLPPPPGPNIVVPAVVSDIKASTYIRRRPSDSSDPHPGLCPARAMGYALEQTANLATQAAAPSSNFNFCRRHFVDPIS